METAPDVGPDSTGAGTAGTAMTGRLVLLSTSPRVAPGLLSGQAWSALRSAGSVHCAAQHPVRPYVEAEGIAPQIEDVADPQALAGRLTAAAGEHGTAVWLVGPDGDAALGTALGEIAEGGQAPELEMLPGSYDLPGARLLDLVATMDRLRSPGGCPWDAAQTHESLTTYLVEETYEALEAIETGDRAHLREELGDLLLQVAFHSRIAAEHDQDPWSVDDVAGDIVDKLVRRHPHVFSTAAAPTTASEVETSWYALKAAEKGRASVVEGVPLALPALSLAAKLIQRARSHGVMVEPVEPVEPGETGGGGVGRRLMALVAEAHTAGLDAESELRAVARRYADRLRAAEDEAGTRDG